jgi:RecJ-like exonuclease
MTTRHRFYAHRSEGNAHPCPECNGTGKHEATGKCVKCDGLGEVVSPAPAETYTLELCESGLGRSEARVIEQITFGSETELRAYSESTPLRDGFFYRRATDLAGKPY